MSNAAFPRDRPNLGKNQCGKYNELLLFIIASPKDSADGSQISATFAHLQYVTFKFPVPHGLKI